MNRRPVSFGVWRSDLNKGRKETAWRVKYDAKSLRAMIEQLGEGRSSATVRGKEQ